jgi:hypothetical protein
VAGVKLARRITWYSLFVLFCLTLAIAQIFRLGIKANGDSLIASPLDSHLTASQVKAHMGRIVDSDNLAWPGTTDEASSMLELWMSFGEAAAETDSVYHCFYGTDYGLNHLMQKQLMGQLDGQFSADAGLSGIYAQWGYDAVSTISGELNAQIYTALKAMGGTNAACMAMDYSTGAILASVSFPTLSNEGMDGWTRDGVLSSVYTLGGTFAFSAPLEYMGQTLPFSLPYNLLTDICAIANGGQAYQPFAVSKLVSRSDGSVVSQTQPQLITTVILSGNSVAAQEQRMAAICGNAQQLGSWAAGLRAQGLNVLAETGSAQNGSSGNTACWLAGYVKDVPVAVIVLSDSTQAVVNTAAGEVITAVVEHYTKG